MFAYRCVLCVFRGLKKPEKSKQASKKTITESRALINNMIIRELRIEDYDALMALWDDAKLPYRPKGRDMRDNIERQLKQNNAIYLIAEIDGKLVGSILGTHDGRKGWINRLAVSPAFRKRGIAARLVAEIESCLSKWGLK